MSTQGLSRKRPAPGTSPPGYQQAFQSNQQYSGAQGSELSNDQFLQWSENLKNEPQTTTPYFNDTKYANTSSSVPGDAQASSQLVKLPHSQLIPRSRDQSNVVATQSAQRSDESPPPPGDYVGGDDLPRLQAHALEAKKEAQAKRKQIPPFVQKLSSFLDQSKNTELIRWSDDGKSFIVLDEDEFARTLIPELFKHNNYASFVRQLNMYGFHKKVGLADNSMRASERKNKSPSEYSHDYFRRGHPELLWAIQKPKNSSGGPKGKAKKDQDGPDVDDNDDYIEDVSVGGIQAARPRLAIEQASHSMSSNTQELARLVQNELRAIRAQQAAIAKTIQDLKQEHQNLYSQAMTFQEQHTRHENSINAILTFLATVYDKSLRDGTSNINNLFGGAIPQDASQGNVVDVGDYSFVHDSTDMLQRPFRKQPLLLKAPPSANDVLSGRATTMSPSTAGSPHDGRQSRNLFQPHRDSQVAGQGKIEEMFDPSFAGNQPNTNLPSHSMMSVIQNANAKILGGTGNAADIHSALNSLETAGGPNPLTDSQRADMLQLINNQGDQQSSVNNALVSPNPPAMPINYGSKLARTSAEIDRLAKMQAEQDQSVQNLEKLLQPLSPSGSIPGISGDQEVPIPSGLDLDEIFKTSDYFNGADSSFFDSKPQTDDQGNSFNADVFNDDELFDSVDPAGYNGQSQGMNHQQYGMYNSDNDGEHVGGRVESVASSEATTPANTHDIDGYTARLRAGTASAKAGHPDGHPPKKRLRSAS